MSPEMPTEVEPRSRAPSLLEAIEETFLALLFLAMGITVLLEGLPRD